MCGETICTFLSFGNLLNGAHVLKRNRALLTSGNTAKPGG
nr:MAG TPA: hypothetical protein [Caudoviricetes sp.]